MANVGTTINESVAAGASAFREPAKRNIGILGQFVRGASFTPTKINSLEEFNNLFGGQSSLYYSPAIVKSIFDEAGSARVTLYLARVTNDDFITASGSVALSTLSTMDVTAGYKGMEDSGVWANGIIFTLYSYGSRMKENFTLTVTYDGAVQETYHGTTLASIQADVNRVSKYGIVEFSREIETLTFTALTGSITTSTSSNIVQGSGTSFDSTYVGSVLYDMNKSVIGTVSSVSDATHLTLVSRALVTAANASFQKRKDTVWKVALSGGMNGEVTESDFVPVESLTEPKGLACFDGVDVQLLAIGEYHNINMAKILNSYVQEKKTAFGVCNLPMNADEGTAELYSINFRTNGISYMASYLGWIRVLDNAGNSIVIPSIGAVLGAGYLRTPYLSGDFIHIPPAGYDSMLNTVLEVIPNRLSQTSINRIVQQFLCNILLYSENEGYYIGSSRTYSTNELYMSIHIRLQTSYYRRALYLRLRQFEQKPNTPELKNSVLVTLNQFFRSEYDNGALERELAFNKAYQGICDRGNNPLGQDRKILNITVQWIPTEAIESIVLELERNDGILKVTEAE